ncbi:MAG: hypothetical protein HQK89_14915 [Nitrospirae bacterium]|nr:hypothetical protein [Nitrospirota bacterium]
MKTYRLKLRLKSSFLTPWQSDSIFGALMWEMLWLYDEQQLTTFLDECYNGSPPFIVSDGFPAGYMPTCHHISLAGKDSREIDAESGDGIAGSIEGYDKELEAYEKTKSFKKIEWLTYDDFLSVKNGSYEIGIKHNVTAFKPRVTLHSMISRLTQTTGDEGTLYEMEEFVPNIDDDDIDSNYINIYVKVREGDWEEKVFALFKALSYTGFGKKASSGKGSFDVIGGLEPIEDFDDFDGANGFVSLSHFVPAKDDPVEGYYKVLVKYGKLGGEFAFSDNPFKKPIIMFTPGSVFYYKREVKPFYGRMIKDISYSMFKDKVIMHCGFAFNVAAKLPKLQSCR